MIKLAIGARECSELARETGQPKGCPMDGVAIGQVKWLQEAWREEEPNRRGDLGAVLAKDKV